MKWIKAIQLCSPESQREIKKIVSKDLQLMLHELYDEEKNDIVNVKPENPKNTEKAKRHKPRKNVTKTIEVPMIFGRKFPTVKSACDYFNIPTGTLYYWIEKGMDIEKMLKNRGKIPPETNAHNKTIIKGTDKQGNKIYRA